MWVKIQRFPCGFSNPWNIYRKQKFKKNLNKLDLQNHIKIIITRFEKQRETSVCKQWENLRKWIFLTLFIDRPWPSNSLSLLSYFSRIIFFWETLKVRWATRELPSSIYHLVFTAQQMVGSKGNFSHFENDSY